MNLQPSGVGGVSNSPGLRAWQGWLGYSPGGWSACCNNDKTDASSTASSTLSPRLRGAIHTTETIKVRQKLFIMDRKKKIALRPWGG